MSSIDYSLREAREAILAAQRATTVDQEPRLKGHGGGGTSGGVTDDWKASVDRQLDRLHSDVRSLLYGLIGGVVALVSAGFAIQQSLDGRIDKLEATLSRVEAKVDRLDRIESKLDTFLAAQAALRDQQGYRGGTDAEAAPATR